MPVSGTDRLKAARQAAAEECQRLFDRLAIRRGLPSSLTVRLTGVWRESGEVAQSEVSLSIPKALTYDSGGRLTSDIKGHRVSVLNDGKRHFRVTIDGKQYPQLRVGLVEGELGIAVRKKRSGLQTGYPSEPVGGAVWRHLVDRHNLLDKSVEYAGSPG
jgi:hypothetical protein